jgi:hypothetical protein
VELPDTAEYEQLRKRRARRIRRARRLTSGLTATPPDMLAYMRDGVDCANDDPAASRTIVTAMDKTFMTSSEAVVAASRAETAVV